GRRLKIAKALGYDNTIMPSPSTSPSLSPSSGGNTILNTSEELLSLDAAMARHIETALSHTQGRIEGPSGAAGILKINPHTLRARMRKLDIDWKSYRPSG
ncbi:MAG: sigma-54-dependent Fis family transcriptional regulator, partial [Planctomycetota bacterium]|nr:sigma-54-dependent Fis family transcriptional regulator [Planctomycetota bacterium]